MGRGDGPLEVVATYSVLRARSPSVSGESNSAMQHFIITPCLQSAFQLKPFRPHSQLAPDATRMRDKRILTLQDSLLSCSPAMHLRLPRQCGRQAGAGSSRRSCLPLVDSHALGQASVACNVYGVGLSACLQAMAHPGCLLAARAAAHSHAAASPLSCLVMCYLLCSTRVYDPIP